MHVFVTGATGFVGSAVVSELLGAGHAVTGLARNDASAAALLAAGAEVHRGDLTDLGSLTSGACAADGVVHTAFIHDFSAYAAAAAVDLATVGALADALARTGKPFVSTSATGFLARGRLNTEDDDAPPDRASGPRVAAEQAVLASAQRGACAPACCACRTACTGRATRVSCPL